MAKNTNTNRPTLDELRTFQELLAKYTTTDFVDAACYYSNTPAYKIAEMANVYPSAISAWKNKEPIIMERLRNITAIPFEQ